MASRPKRPPADGYPSLAGFMASDRDRAIMVFKRFDRLTARTLLYLQSELAELQKRLEEYDEQDRALPEARSWESFKEKGRVEPERIEVVNKIRDTMLEYKTLLAHETTLSSLMTPSRKVQKAFRFNFFHGDPRDPQSYPILGGASSTVYDDAGDLIVMNSGLQDDRMSSFVNNYLGCFFPEHDTLDGASTIDRVAYTSGSRIKRFVTVISTMLAALLLMAAIVVLYKVKSPDLKLGLIGIFTALFSGSVGILTNARQAEIFGATAAYAAVLVVFISSDFGDSS